MKSNSLLENSLLENLSKAEFIGDSARMKKYLDMDKKEIETLSCYQTPPGCDCVCHQPCHGEGPCYSL